MPWLLTRRGLLTKHTEKTEKWCNEHLVYEKANPFKKRNLPPVKAVMWRTYTMGDLKLIAIPRMTPYVLKQFSGVIKYKIPQIAAIDIQSSIILRPAQTQCLDLIVEKLNTTRGLTLQINVGKGKSYIAAKLIERMKLPTLYLCHNVLSLEQFADKIFPTYTGANDSPLLGVYYGKKKRPGLLTVAVINSVMKLPHSWFTQFGLIVVDEVTEMISTLRRKVFWNMNSQYMVGMTATPHEKKMRFDVIYELHCGPIFNANYLFKDELDDPCTVHAIRYCGPDEFTQHIYVNDTVSIMKMHAQFARDPNRNALIIREALRIAKLGKPLYIFSVIQDALNIIEELLKPHKYPVYMLTGTRKDLTPQELNKIGETFIVLTTYKAGSIGLSINAMRAAIFANSMMANMRQTFGRIFRELTGENREIVDIIDQCTNVKSHYTRTRKKLYAAKKFKVIESKIKWQDVDVFKK